MSEIKKPVIKPIRIMIPNTMFTEEEDHSICFFCKSDDKKEIVEYIEKHPIPGLSKVIAMNEVKKYYHEIKDKKLLLKSYTHFICDASIAPQLYNVLGSTFSARNNYPVQIRFQKKLSSLQDSIQKVINSTYFHLGGKNICVKFGILSMSPEEVSQNIIVGLPHFISKLQNEWKDVHSIHIKTTDSASLPLYSKVVTDMSQYVAEQAAATTKKQSSIATSTTSSTVSINKLNISTTTTSTLEKQKIVKTNKDSVNSKIPLKTKSNLSKRSHDSIDNHIAAVVTKEPFTAVSTTNNTTTNNDTTNNDNTNNDTTTVNTKKKVVGTNKFGTTKTNTTTTTAVAVVIANNVKSITKIATDSSTSVTSSDSKITNKKSKNIVIEKKQQQVEVTTVIPPPPPSMNSQRKSTRNIKK